MTPLTPNLSLRELRHVKAAPTYRWPRSPRPIPSETLASYCVRLGAHYGLTPSDVLEQLGIPRSVAYEVLERESTGLLAERLAITTGRPYPRFEMLRLEANQACLPFSERTGFCPQCWLERRCAQAAYLDRHWARPYGLTCYKHTGVLLHEWTRVDAWPELFSNRSAWRQLMLQPLPEVWLLACESLHLDPAVEWQQAKSCLHHYEQGMHAITCGTPIDDELRIFSDFVTYLQIQWNPSQRLAELGAPAYSIYEQALCYERFVQGGLGLRLRALIAARHLRGSLLAVGHRSELADKLLTDVQTRKKTHVEAWWLKRRILRWPTARRAHAMEMLGLSRTCADEIAPFDSCRTCLGVASRYNNRWLYASLSEEFQCRHDPCG